MEKPIYLLVNALRSPLFIFLFGSLLFIFSQENKIECDLVKNQSSVSAFQYPDSTSIDLIDLINVIPSPYESLFYYKKEDYQKKLYVKNEVITPFSLGREFYWMFFYFNVESTASEFHKRQFLTQANAMNLNFSEVGKCLSNKTDRTGYEAQEELLLAFVKDLERLQQSVNEFKVAEILLGFQVAITRFSLHHLNYLGESVKRKKVFSAVNVLFYEQFAIVAADYLKLNPTVQAAFANFTKTCAEQNIPVTVIEPHICTTQDIAHLISCCQVECCSGSTQGLKIPSNITTESIDSLNTSLKNLILAYDVMKLP